MCKAVLLSLGLVLASSAALAQVPCGERAKIVGWLGVNYKEAPVATGVSNKGALVEVLSSVDGETWTIIITKPDGISCIVDTGQAWQPRPPEYDVAEPQA
ncbi:MAG: hypothetical protein R3322_07675 [Kiloniellales bacterium]|jgi:hypothetical protein|nr:hypothetical protein [Kiloniellales bacterium]